MFSPYELVPEKKKYNRQGILYAIDPVVNLATVNYILHGLQRYGFDKVDHKCWHTLWVALGIDHHFAKHPFYGSGTSFSQEMKQTMEELEKIDSESTRDSVKAMERFTYILKMRTMRRKLVDYLVKHVIKPFGIPRGSEKQGQFVACMCFTYIPAPISSSCFHHLSRRWAAPGEQRASALARGLCHSHGD